MSNIKPKGYQKKRAVLNTTINEEVLNDFKTYCKELGLPMNILIESFMRQISNDEFVLKFGKNKNIEIDLEDM